MPSLRWDFDAYDFFDEFRLNSLLKKPGLCCFDDVMALCDRVLAAEEKGWDLCGPRLLTGLTESFTTYLYRKGFVDLTPAEQEKMTRTDRWGLLAAIIVLPFCIGGIIFLVWALWPIVRIFGTILGLALLGAIGSAIGTIFTVLVFHFLVDPFGTLKKSVPSGGDEEASRRNNTPSSPEGRRELEILEEVEAGMKTNLVSAHDAWRILAILKEMKAGTQVRRAALHEAVEAWRRTHSSSQQTYDLMRDTEEEKHIELLQKKLTETGSSDAYWELRDAGASDQEWIPPLIDALFDKRNHCARAKSRELLMDLHAQGMTAGLIPRLTETLRHGNHADRVDALDVLTRIADRSVLPVLRELTGDKNAYLRKAAREAVEKIEGIQVKTPTTPQPMEQKSEEPNALGKKREQELSNGAIADAVCNYRLGLRRVHGEVDRKEAEQFLMKLRAEDVVHVIDAEIVRIAHAYHDRPGSHGGDLIETEKLDLLDLKERIQSKGQRGSASTMGVREHRH